MEKNITKITKTIIYSLMLLTSFGITNAFATDKVVNLVVEYKTVYFAGKPRKAISVNNQIPAPTLHFKEGDHVSINVYNHLDEETAVHWHGMLVPWQMDGVLGITQKGIPPGGVFHYQFTLHQSGTYWYHAHAGLQEQLGLYGAFLIDPPKKPHYAYTKDYVVVLSDWSNTHPDQILANLKKEGDYYSPRFPLQPSLVKFIHDYRKASTEEREKIIDDYKMMQQMRMSIYDISDVAYDAFLLNGQPPSSPWTAPVKIGDVVRLRFIGAGGSTIFHVKIPGTSMQVVHVQGNDVAPYSLEDFKIAPGETYDVLVKIQKNDPYIIYAESIDTLGAAYGALVTSSNLLVNYQSVKPFPEPLPVMREMMALMMNDGSSSMNMSSMHSMKMNSQDTHHAGAISHSTQMSKAMSMDHDMPMESKKVDTKSVTTNHSAHAADKSMSKAMSMNEQMKSDPNMKMDSMPDDGMAMEAKKTVDKSIKTSNSHAAHTSVSKTMSLSEQMKLDPSMKMDSMPDDGMAMETKKTVDKSIKTSNSHAAHTSASKTMSMSEQMKLDPNMKMDPMPDDGMAMEAKKTIDKSIKTSNSHAAHTSVSKTMSMSEQMKLDPNMKMDSMPDDGMARGTKKTVDKSIKTSNSHATHTSASKAMSMSEQMKLDPNMKMDSSAPMSHSMSHTAEVDSHSTMSKSMNMTGGMHMDHDMSMPTEPTIIGDTISPPSSFQKTIGTKYQNLKATYKTNNPNKPIAGVIKMELFGYMERFIWFINGVPEYNAHPIPLEPNKRYRFIFTNPSMMRHPMHLHGHWFILRNGHGSYDPLLHTIDVPPGATVTADVDTDASGQWLFHCHLLYHMMTGMSRVFQYTTLLEITQDKAKPQNIIKETGYYNRPIVRVDEVRPIDPMLVHHPMAHRMGLFLANFLDVGADPFQNFQKLTFKGLYGRDYDKLELFMNDAEMQKGNVENADMDIFYWHLLNQFWAVKGGVNYFYRPAQTPYWQPGIGIEGLMPYFIDTSVRGYFHSGSAKLDVELSRDSQITNNFFIRAGVRSILATKTVAQAEIGSGLNQMRYIIRPYYRVMPGLNVFAEYEYEKNYGSFKTLQRSVGESASQNTLTFGLGLLF